MNFRSGMTFSSSIGIDSANQRGDPPVLKFHDDRPLNVGSRCDDAGRVIDFRFECSPVAQDVFRAHENVRIEIDHFLTQFPIEPGHNRNDENQDRHAEHYAEH